MVEDEWGHFNHRAAVGLGVAQLMLGLFSVVVGVEAIFAQTALGYFGYGVWCGAIFIIAGLIALASGVSSNESSVAKSTAASIGSIAASLVQLAFSIYGLVYNSQQRACTECSLNTLTPYCTRWTSNAILCLDYNDFRIVLWTGAVLISAGAINLAVAFATVCLSCPCCRRRPANKVSPEACDVPMAVAAAGLIAAPIDGDKSAEHDVTPAPMTQENGGLDPLTTDNAALDRYKTEPPDTAVYPDPEPLRSPARPAVDGPLQTSYPSSIPKWLAERKQGGAATWNPAYPPIGSQ